MIVTMLTAMYMVVRVVEKIGVLFARSDPPLPFLVTHPLPWQVHHVSQKRRSSATAECDGQTRNSVGVFRKINSDIFPNATLAVAVATLTVPCLLTCDRKDSACGNGCAAAPLSPTLPVEKAAATIQNQFRKYQQKKKETNCYALTIQYKYLETIRGSLKSSSLTSVMSLTLSTGTIKKRVVLTTMNTLYLTDHKNHSDHKTTAVSIRHHSGPQGQLQTKSTTGLMLLDTVTTLAAIGFTDHKPF
ncbi:unnamed protein product [Oncorhynchus mykiss]|uniref:Uncharacterized protein n=1 Tax=Oncorhynchus mykiss TaxID=8022 RepID=A0A060XJD4_ONCMY|nr:unnamed protein product [Oncorhynchus mykiss]